MKAILISLGYIVTRHFRGLLWTEFLLMVSTKKYPKEEFYEENTLVRIP